MKCYKCHKKIDDKKEKYVHLGTYKGEKTMHEIWFHFQCWVDYFNEKLMSRIKKGQDMAMGMLKGAMDNLNVQIKNG